MWVIYINVKDGVVFVVVDEQFEMFFDYLNKIYYLFLEDINEIIWMSERDGWNYFYLIDVVLGEVKNLII